MRWITNWTILATIAATAAATATTAETAATPATATAAAAATATETATSASTEDDARPKRDIALIKNFITTKLFGGTVAVPESQPNYRLFRIPGFDNVLVKAIPKVNLAVEETPLVVEHTQEVHPSIALVSSYLGTKSLNETVTALEKVKTLLQSGVLSTRDAADVPIRVPIRISPGVTETFEVIDTDGKECKIPTHQHTVPIPYLPVVERLYKRVRIPIPSLAYPTKYSYKQIGLDGTTTYESDDAKNVVVTESKEPSQLPQYLSRRFQEILALGIHPVSLPPVPVITSPTHNIPVNIYGSLSMNPILAPHVPVPVEVPSTYVPVDYSYKHLHRDGSVSTYSGSGERIEKPTVHFSSLQPSLHISQPPQVLVNSRIPVAPAVLPGGYSYTHLHNDGHVTTYSGAGAVNNIEKRPAFIMEEVRRPEPFPSIVASPAPPPAVIGEVVHRPPIPVYAEAALHKPTIVNQAVVPTNFSYKHIHSDGSVTTYSDAGVVETIKERPSIVVEEVRRPVLAHPVLPPAVIEETVYRPSIPIYEKVPSGYSYNHLHNDGTVTSYSGAGVIEKINDRPAIVVQEVRRPVPLPTFFANRIENVAATAHSYRFPPPAVIAETVYRPPIPVFQESYPVLLEHLTGSIPKPLNPHFNEEVNINFNKNTNNNSTGYSYQTTHQGGTSIVYFGSGVVQENNKTHDGAMVASANDNHHNSINKELNKENCQNGTQIKVDISNKTSGFSYTTVHNDGSVTSHTHSEKDKENLATEHTKPSVPKRKSFKPRVSTRVRRPNNTKGAVESHDILTSKSVVSQYSYRQINHHLPSTPFTVVNVGDLPKNDARINVQIDVDNTSYKGESRISELTNDYIATGSTLRPVVTERNSPVSGFSFKHTTNHGVYSNSNGAVDFKPETSVRRSNDNIGGHKEVFYTTEATVSSSAISLSANPIVVLPDENIFSYKQDKVGSSFTVVADKTNKVSVVEENKRESHRGDIPDTYY